MSYAQRATKSSASTLDLILPEYTKVSEAPSNSEMEEWAPELQAAEREKRYKAMDGDGNVFLVANPNLPRWKLTNHANREVKISLITQPTFKYTAAQVQEQLGEKRSERAKERSRRRRKQRSGDPHLFDVSKDRKDWDDDEDF